MIKLYTLAEAARMTGIPQSVWQQAAVNGRIRTRQKYVENNSTHILHHITRSEINRFVRLCRDNGQYFPTPIVAPGPSPARRTNNNPSDVAMRIARRRAEIIREAKEMDVDVNWLMEEAGIKNNQHG